MTTWHTKYDVSIVPENFFSLLPFKYMKLLYEVPKCYCAIFFNCHCCVVKSTENKYTMTGSWSNVIATVMVCLSYCFKAEQTQVMQQNMHFALSRFYCIHAVRKQSHIFCDEICFCKSFLYSKVTPEHTMKAYGAVEVWLQSLISWQ
jgi:hypothetical protein